jgi:hypothetical protein
MQLFPILIFVGWTAFLFLRRAQRIRQRWLRRLNLPGSWRWDSGESSLNLSGELSSGSFLLREPGQQRSGRWRLLGNSLELHATKGDADGYQPYVFDLRLFGSGKLGLHGPGREGRVYERGSENVVPMRAR